MNLIKYVKGYFELLTFSDEVDLFTFIMGIVLLPLVLVLGPVILLFMFLDKIVLWRKK